MLSNKFTSEYVIDENWVVCDSLLLYVLPLVESKLWIRNKLEYFQYYNNQLIENQSF
jgi:hypothetical protein